MLIGTDLGTMFTKDANVELSNVNTENAATKADVESSLEETEVESSSNDSLTEPLLTSSLENDISREGGGEEETEPAVLIIEELSPRNDDIIERKTNPPLAWAPTTPCWATWLIPLAILATHALFLYGQIEPMWRMHEAQDVDLWYNATSTPASLIYRAFGLPQQLEITHHEESTLQTFTYSFAIQELWVAAGMPDKKMARVAAVLLALFSGVWPHLKLLLLNLTWLTMRNQKRRTRCLHWLSCLGKWSLADILVVCVMVGVLHIDWHVDPEAIREGVRGHLPFLLELVKSQFTNEELCSKLLSADCAHYSILHVQCNACIVALKEKDWTGSFGQTILNGISASGDGLMTLRVIGMRGIYAFCAAVVISIFLSLVIDVWDHKASNYELLQTAAAQDETDDEEILMESSLTDETPATLSARYNLLNDDIADQEIQVLSSDRVTPPSHLSVEMGSAGQEEGDVAFSVSIRWCSCMHGFISFCVVILTIFACLQVTFERKVEGAIPTLLNEVLGMEWTKFYSLHSLSETTGAAGGWDYMLQGTFCLFIVFGPIVRSILCVMGHILPGRLSTIQTFCDLIGAFCAWEVLVIAVVMIGMLMPSITGTILMDDRCKEIGETGYCFQVSYEILSTFYTIIAAGIALILLSNSFSFFAKQRRDGARR